MLNDIISSVIFEKYFVRRKFILIQSKNKKSRFYTSAISFALVVAMGTGMMFGATACKPKNTPPAVTDPGENRVVDDNPTTNSANTIISPVESVNGDKYEYDYSATTAVGYSSKVIGNVDRKKPVAEVRNEGLPEYPVYGYTLKSVIGTGANEVAARDALIAESVYLMAKSSGDGQKGDYTWMDENGYLYTGTTAQPVQSVNPDGTRRQLYEHTTAKGMYLGGLNGTDELLDSEPGLVKEVTIRPRGYNSYSVTGLYAPAGEVIKIEISEADMKATGGLTIHIGQALYNGQSNNIWTAKNQMQRFPNVLNTMIVNKNTATLENGVYTAYVGSFVGGPIYIRNTSATYTATISGGVAYSHFILGYTTKEEFEENKKTSTPYFDLEVWNYGVLHSGPKYYARNFSYEDIYKAAIVWEKVSSVTTTGSSQGIVFLYEPFVAAGAAVAFPGRSSVNCPTDWMNGSLNYNQIVTSGSWGNFHEYHHNFQGYGVGNGGEVTNNGMTLVSYALFTKISAKRGMESFGGQGLGGWNNYTSATWALNDLLSIQRGGHPSNGDRGLAIYSTLLHNFGANNYIQAKYKQQVSHYGQSYQGYLRAWQDITHNDMTYFFKDVLKGIDQTVADKWRNPDYPVFVPVSSVYQTGRSYMCDGEKKYFHTMQPYVIPYGEEFTIDLNQYSAPNNQYAGGSIVIPDGFDYKIKSISKPAHGSLEAIDDYKFKFTPDETMRSGQIIVTLEITKKDKAFKVDDVDLVLEFEQSHETNKMTLERTTYTYTAENMYADATVAYDNNFENYTSVVEKANHTNPTQNCNTDIWFYPNDDKTHEAHPTSPDSHFVHPNTIEVLDGKLYFEEQGKYRIYLRGRTNCAVYYSLDGGKTYELGAKVTKGSGSGFYLNNPETYFDIELEKNSWVYVKEVLIVQDKPVISYIGLGYGKWSTPMFTIVEKYFDKAGNEVSSPDDENYFRTETHYYDLNGNEVTEEEANNAQPIAPTKASYINAYRTNYEFPDNAGFVSDYFYTRNYTYNYSDNVWANENAKQTVTSENYKPWDANEHKLEHLADGDRTTRSHTNFTPTEAKPFIFTVDMGAEKTVSRMVIYSQNRSDLMIVKAFTLYGSKDGTNFFEVYKEDDAPNKGSTVTVNFPEATFRYYKMEVTRSSGRYIIIDEIEMWKIFEINGGTQFTPDNKAFTYGGNWQIKSTQSTFGHVFVGSKNAEMAFKFKGNRLALLSSDAFDRNFEVTIDGKKVSSIDLKAITGGYGASFISDLLEDTEHTVVIKCLGEANLDSIVIYK